MVVSVISKIKNRLLSEPLARTTETKSFVEDTDHIYSTLSFVS